MKKIILTLLTSLGCSVGLMAQTDDNALCIHFTGMGNPIETEHMLEGTHITFSGDGENMNLTVNNATVTYDLNNVSGMSHFNGDPQVLLHANQDPDNEGKYYTTFYSGLEAYTMPQGAKAYKASVSDNTIVLTRVADEGEILPQGEAVLLFTEANGGVITMSTTDGTGYVKSDDNVFRGVDVATAQTGTAHMLSYGQNKLGFYKMGSSMMLTANKAFLPATPAMVNINAFSMIFDDGEVMGIDITNDNDMLRYDNDDIYSVGGIRRNNLQRGINVVGGKKVMVK